MDNFGFLEQDFPSLAELGRLAEGYCLSDPSSSIVKLSILCEQIVSMMFKFDRIPDPYDMTWRGRLNCLHREGLLEKSQGVLLMELWGFRGDAAHTGVGNAKTARQYLRRIHSFAG